MARFGRGFLPWRPIPLTVPAATSFSSTATLTTAGLSVASTSAESFDSTASLTLAGLQVDALMGDVATPLLVGGLVDGSSLVNPLSPWTRLDISQQEEIPAPALVLPMVAFDVAGGLTTAGLQVDAVATETFAVSAAALTLAGLSVAASALETFPTTAALTVAGLSVSAAAAESFDSSAALTLAGLQVDAAVSADISTPLLLGGVVDGSALVGPFAIWTRADIGYQEEVPAPGLVTQLVVSLSFDATAALTLAGLQVDATAAESFDSTAALTLAGLSVSAAAIETFSSTAALTVAGLSVAAAGVESFDASAALTLAGLQVDAVVSADIATPLLFGGIIDGSALLSPFSAWSRADLLQQEDVPASGLISQLVTYDVTGDLVLAGLSVAAGVAESFDSTADLTLAGLSVAASIPATSTAALTTAGLSVSATAAESFPTTAVLTTAGLSVAAVAAESFDATAALTVGGLQVDAVVSADVPTVSTPLLVGGIIDGSAFVGPLALWTRADVSWLEEVPAPALVSQFFVYDTTADLTLAGLSVAAAAAESFDSTASLTLAGLQVDAISSADIATPLLVGGIIDGSALVGPFAVWTRADVSQQEETPPPGLLAQPPVLFDSTAGLTVAGLSVSAAAAESFDANAALTVAGLSVASVGVETFSFTAALTVAGLSVAARVPATSTAALTTAGLSVAASAQETFAAAATLTTAGLSVAATVNIVILFASQLTTAGLAVVAAATTQDAISPLVFPPCPTAASLAVSTVGCDLRLSLRGIALQPSIMGADLRPSILAADLSNSAVEAMLDSSEEGVLIPC